MTFNTVGVLDSSFEDAQLPLHLTVRTKPSLHPDSLPESLTNHARVQVAASFLSIITISSLLATLGEFQVCSLSCRQSNLRSLPDLARRLTTPPPTSFTLPQDSQTDLKSICFASLPSWSPPCSRSRPTAATGSLPAAGPPWCSDAWPSPCSSSGSLQS